MTGPSADEDRPAPVVPYLLKCATPDCDSIVTVTDAADIDGWTVLEDEEFGEMWWLCPKCPIEEDDFHA